MMEDWVDEKKDVDVIIALKMAPNPLYFCIAKLV